MFCLSHLAHGAAKSLQASARMTFPVCCCLLLAVCCSPLFAAACCCSLLLLLLLGCCCLAAAWLLLLLLGSCCLLLLPLPLLVTVIVVVAAAAAAAAVAGVVVCVAMSCLCWGCIGGALLTLSFTLGHDMLRFPARLLLLKEPQRCFFPWLSPPPLGHKFRIVKSAIRKRQSKLAWLSGSYRTCLTACFVVCCDSKAFEAVKKRFLDKRGLESSGPQRQQENAAV